MDVKVHLCNEEEKETRSEIAAALAESARQLAQSAANFGQEEEEEEWQRRVWHSKSLPYNSHSSLNSRTALGTTHSLPLHSNKRKLVSSYSSANLPPSNRDPGLPSYAHAPPTASLDRPRHMVSLDHPITAGHAYENYRRNSLSHRYPPPESPLTISHNSRLSSPSQRSLSSNSEYAPAHHHNMPLPVHLRPHRLLSRRVSEPGERMGVYQSHIPMSMGHVHSDTSRTPNGSKHLSVASLDFNSPKPQSERSHISRLNGMRDPACSPDLQTQLEDLNVRLESVDHSGVHNGNGSDSNTSTLRGSSHSGTLDTKNRLSRLSEQSEHNENDSEHVMNHDDSHSCSEEDGHHEHYMAQRMNPVSSVARQRGYPPGHDERYLTLPNHYRKVTIQQPPSTCTPASPTLDTQTEDQRLSGSQVTPLSPNSSTEMVSVTAAGMWPAARGRPD